jgi:hypothetical protein
MLTLEDNVNNFFYSGKIWFNDFALTYVTSFMLIKILEIFLHVIGVCLQRIIQRLPLIKTRKY